MIRKGSGAGYEGKAGTKYRFFYFMFLVYVLYSRDYGKIYIGYTSNLEERLRSHNELSKKGWTIRYRPWEVAYTEVHETKEQAMLREKQLKSAQGRQFIRKLVEDKYR